MTEQEWLDCTDPKRMLEFLGEKVSDRKLRLFGCECVRRIADLLLDERSLKAIEVAERFADGNSSNRERRAAFEAAGWGIDTAARHGSCYYFPAVAARELVENEVCGPWSCGWYGAVRGGITIAQRRRQSELLREIVGNPFRPVALEYGWATLTVKQVAAATYEERAFDRLPILADALEDAGCSTQIILNHLRQPGEHKRGCWALDLILKKE